MPVTTPAWRLPDCRVFSKPFVQPGILAYSGSDSRRPSYQSLLFLPARPTRALHGCNSRGGHSSTRNNSSLLDALPATDPTASSEAAAVLQCLAGLDIHSQAGMATTAKRHVAWDPGPVKLHTRISLQHVAVRDKAHSCTALAAASDGQAWHSSTRWLTAAYIYHMMPTAQDVRMLWHAAHAVRAQGQQEGGIALSAPLLTMMDLCQCPDAASVHRHYIRIQQRGCLVWTCPLTFLCAANADIIVHVAIVTLEQKVMWLADGRHIVPILRPEHDSLPFGMALELHAACVHSAAARQPHPSSADILPDLYVLHYILSGCGEVLHHSHVAERIVLLCTSGS